MVVIPVVKQININSKLYNYSVEFNLNSKRLLKKINDESYVLIDKNLLKYSKINNLDKLYSNKIIKIIPKENAKEFHEIGRVIDKLLKLGIKKKSKLYVIGGGILQDIGGFISSILFRGIQWEYIPTTLLSQGDSCIGSKTSINFKQFKNQIGTFRPPLKINIDFSFLKTLSKSDLFSGLGEMSHYLIIGGEKTFRILENELNNTKINYKKLIFESLYIKKKYIEKDEFDNSIRNILNYGHTFGHAIESATNYNVPHGIAVSLGIDISNYFSVKHNLMNNQDKDRIKKTLIKIFGKIEIKTININKIFQAIKNDKKSDKRFINLIMCIRPGNMVIKRIMIDNNFKKLLNSYFKNL